MKLSTAAIALACVVASASAFTQPALTRGSRQTFALFEQQQQKQQDQQQDLQPTSSQAQEQQSQQSGKQQEPTSNAVSSGGDDEKLVSNTGLPDFIEDNIKPPPDFNEMAREALPSPEMSPSLPWMKRPAVLDGSMPGDVGFDPFGFAKTKEDLLNYREAEIKHARLAMLAAAGWPISELLDRQIAQAFNLPTVLGADDRAPSLLNGGLDRISPIYWGSVLLAAAAIDLYGIRKSKSNDPDYFPGNLGFDPLGLYPKDKDAQFRMQLAEIKNGRLAMIAITAFAFQEYVQKLGVVDETPVFFKPIGTVMKEYTNSGYYVPDQI